MSRVQEFYDRVEAEYNSFINDIETMDTDAVLENAGRIMMFQEVYKYLTEYEPVSEDRYPQILNEEKPIQAICERYRESQEELHETFETIMDSIIEDQAPVKGGECFEELKGKISDLWDDFRLNTVVYIDEDIVRNVYDGICNRGLVLDEDDSKILLQFKNPLLALSYEINNYEQDFDMELSKVMHTFENVDLLMYRHELDKENILPETSYRHDAYVELIKMVPKFDFQTATEWLRFNYAINENGVLIESGLNPYKEFVEVMQGIKEEYGTEVLQKIFDHHEETMAQPEELVEVGKYLADGGDVGRVRELLEDDYFLVPYEDHEQGGMDLC